MLVKKGWTVKRRASNDPSGQRVKSAGPASGRALARWVDATALHEIAALASYGEGKITSVIPIRMVVHFSWRKP